MLKYLKNHRKTYDIIQTELNLHYTETDGLEVGNPEDYVSPTNQEFTNIDKGFSKDEVKEWKRWSRKSKD